MLTQIELNKLHIEMHTLEQIPNLLSRIAKSLEKIEEVISKSDVKKEK